jgi:hypothetical protein
VFFAIIGWNPFIPAIINALITLYATLCLVRLGYEIKTERKSTDWMLGLGMVIPEVVWYDALTSRETLTMSLVSIVTLILGQHFIRNPGKRTPTHRLAIAISAILLLAAIRTSAVIPCVGAVAASQMVLGRMRSGRQASGRAVTGVVLALFLAAPSLVVQFNVLDVGYIKAFENSRNRDFLDNMEGGWGSQSIGKRLIPRNAIEEIVFTIPRLLLYVCAPLPAVRFDMADFIKGFWSEWQYLAGSSSAAIYIMSFPYILASLRDALRLKHRSMLAMHIPLWFTLIAVSCGNVIIVERYRVMAVLFLWGCAWLGVKSDRKVIAGAWLVWLALGVLAGTSYVAMKS